MALINVKIIEGVFTPKQKNDVVRNVTEALAIQGGNVRPYMIVMAQEVKSGDWAIPGKSVTSTEEKAVLAGFAAV